MGMNRTRYIVPFTFGNEADYQEIVINLRRLQWKELVPSARVVDTFYYINHVFSEREGRTNVGSAWQNTTRAPFTLTHKTGKSKKPIEACVEYQGVYIFRTGVGLFWFEMNPTEPVSSDEQIVFQNEMKEFSHANSYHRTFVGKDKFSLGRWIVQQVEQICNGKKAVFHPERKPEWNPEDAVVPDKAILFNFFCIKEEFCAQERLEEIAYYLSNGYKPTYRMPKVNAEQMYRPFSNVVCYASKSGCGYYARYPETSKQFFAQKRREIMYDYFVLYILLLYQSYTLYYFASILEEHLPAEPTYYLQKSKHYIEPLEKNLARINTFLAKSVYASVSHIPHHNDYYNYVETKLGINADIETLTMGLQSLNDLVKMKQQEEQESKNALFNYVIAVVSVMGIVSVVLDLHTMAGVLFGDVGAIALMVIALLVVLAAVFFYRTYISRGGKKDER